ncbi:MAG: hypothetical protein JO332_16290, partial [Planctomycetaceae bacterium]|nr:hypothetical protein [Planctomycetaceae bacterium]
DFKWSADCPKAVDKGAEFLFTVRTIGAGGSEVPNAKFRYQILWPEGSGNPLRYTGWSGTPEKVHARMVPGKATMVVTAENREGLEAKVLETTFEVK